eukprot:318477-Pelagomonas_calceolata.AAC.4
MGEGNLESGSRAHLLHTLIGRHCPQNNMPIWYSEWLHCPLHIRFKDGLGGRYLGSTIFMPTSTSTQKLPFSLPVLLLLILMAKEMDTLQDVNGSSKLHSLHRMQGRARKLAFQVKTPKIRLKTRHVQYNNPTMKGS